MRRALAESATVAGLAGLTCALLAWPWPRDPTGSLIGDSRNDQHALAWTLQWVADRLAAGRLPWGHTDAVAWPDGGTLMPADLLEAVLMAPLTWGFGGIAALGALTLLHHACAAGAAWGWLRARGADALGAAAGALVVALAAPLVVSSWNGNPDVTGIAWVCAALWACEEDRPLAAGLIVGAGALCNPYVAVLGAGAVGLRLARQPRALLRAALPAAALAAVGWGLTSWALSAPDALVSRAPRGAGGLVGTATPGGLLRPWPEILATDPEHGLSRVGTGAYLGAAALLAALLARRDRALGWGLVALGVVAALGPELRLRTEVIAPDGPLLGPPRLAGTGVPLPWALVESLPVLGLMHQTARFGMWSALGLALLVAQAPARLRRAGALVPLAIAVDLVVVAGAPTHLRAVPTDDSGLCAALDGRAAGAVLDWPPTAHELGMAAALCHRRPVADAINRPIPPSLGRRLGPPGRTRDAELRGHARGVGFRWLAVRRALAPDAHADAPPACVAAESHALRLIDLACPADP